MFILMGFPHVPQMLMTMQVTSHRHPVVTVWPASLLPPHPPHTLRHHTLAGDSLPPPPAFKLTGEGAVRPEQSAHIGSPGLPCHTQPSRHPHQPHCHRARRVRYSPTWMHGLTHTASVSQWKRAGRLSEVWETLPQASQALHTRRAWAHPVSRPSVACKGLGVGPAPTC